MNTSKPLSMTLRLILAAGTVLVVTACSSSDDNPPPPAASNFSSFQSASVVNGQANFTSGSPNRGGAAGDNTLMFPYGNPTVGSFVAPDYDNERVLLFTNTPTTNGASANVVLGQPDFTTTGCTASATGMCGPQTAVVAVDPNDLNKKKLFVVDFDFNRVLIWNSVPTTNQTPADVVVGQPDMTTTASGCTGSQLNSPESIAVAGGTLVVVDSSNNRILAWDPIPTTDGVAADFVVGQPDFTTCTPGVSETSLNDPTDVVTNGTKIAVADAGNNRVLIWNTVPDCDPTPCALSTPFDVVLGQADFMSSPPPLDPPTATSFNLPYFLATDGTRLAVADALNNRVLIWNQFPSCTPTPCASTTPANVVLGQPNFTSNTDNNNGSGGSAISAQGLSFPAGLFFNGTNQLIVADNDNSRYLFFQY